MQFTRKSLGATCNYVLCSPLKTSQLYHLPYAPKISRPAQCKLSTSSEVELPSTAEAPDTVEVLVHDPSRRSANYEGIAPGDPSLAERISAQTSLCASRTARRRALTRLPTTSVCIATRSGLVQVTTSFIPLADHIEGLREIRRPQQPAPAP